MNYIDSILFRNEHVVHRAKAHWSIYSWAVFLFVVLLFVSIKGGGREWYKIFFIAGPSFWGSAFLYAFFKRRGTEMAVTSDRIIAKQGVFSRSSIEVFIQHCEGLRVDQSLIGRLFNFGTITITGIGGTHVAFEYIYDPFTFRKVFNEEYARLKSPVSAAG